MTGTFHVVIPARYGSNRLPGKPLVDLAGKPMIVRVAELAGRTGAIDVTVATDDKRVLEAVRAYGLDAILTRSEHRSGSDRVNEVAEQLGFSGESIVINLQGDEPLLPPQLISQLAEAMAADPSCRVCTLREAITATEQMQDPDLVKVVFDTNDSALYFSRAAIPANRADNNYDRLAELGNLGWRHVGLYGFRVAALSEFVRLPPSSLERGEMLEQLRLLESGVGIKVIEAGLPVPAGVDTAADLERVRKIFVEQS